MDILNLIISLVSGAIGGNIAGASMPDKNLGAIGNSLAGLFGGAAGGYILQALDLFTKASPGGAGNEIGAILANVGSGGVGGAIVMIVVALIKNAMQKKG